MPRHPGIRYVFKTEEPLKIKGAAHANAQKIGNALAAITKEHGGRLTPKAVVDSARDEESVLHPHFEWDDSAAAEKWREDQARSVIRCIRIEPIDEKQEPEPAFFSVSDVGVSYRTNYEVKGSTELQEVVLKAAKRDLDAFETRYRTLVDVVFHVKKANIALSKRLSKSESRVSA